ncbi:hypothetical protein LTR78_008525 [Recurvomyces mirabilis]|uniref:Uncharacterized protein n=1 Tax=Recurvomyces mirabilis TaxID=574656 RepID=A0AAE0TPZ5_9PEZI|nr:hypothetical protein LTR78_008525 [Recurvomyces mirabilis]KAK5156276.1 hypothetical protein LTS14_005164 [Recurvomyces mirabilis]
METKPMTSPLPVLGLHLEFIQLGAPACHHTAWCSASTTVSPDESAAELPDLVKVESLRLVVSDRILRTVLRTDEWMLLLDLTMNLPGFRGSGMTLTANLDRVATVADLLDDPRKSGVSLDVGVTLQLVERRSTVQHSIWNRIQLVAPQQLRYEYHHIGEVPIPRDHPRYDIRNLPWIREGHDHDKRMDVKYIWVLLAWREDVEDNWKLSRVHAYDFGDFCIGDCDEWTPWN